MEGLATDSVNMSPRPRGFRCFRRLPPWRYIQRSIFTNIQVYLHSIDDLSCLWLFNSTVAALISHKTLFIRLHIPVSAFGVIALSPCLFLFDLINLVVLHSGFTSSAVVWRIISGIVSVVLIICSSAFASLFINGNAELDWSRSVEVLMEWKFFKGLMAQGNSGFGLIFTLFTLTGGLAVLLRLTVMSRYGKVISREKIQPFDEPLPKERKAFTVTHVAIIVFLLLVTAFLPAHPWRHLTSTLSYDVLTATSTVMMTKYLYQGIDTTCNSADSKLGNHPLGSLKYNPKDDPYYVTNLKEPFDPFFADAFGDAKFTNIVHIVLESMREDSYPYQEDGLLHQHIQKNMVPVEGGTPVNTKTVTPFIDSLSEHLLSWHTMWATIPYTHKTMLGYWCGMVPVPMDWAVEAMAPAKFYQYCFPQVLRYMNSVANSETELLGLFNSSRPRTTDQWETVHIGSSTGEWDLGKEIIKNTGFQAVMTAEHLAELNGGKNFDHPFGYFDEDSLDELWKYVDHTTARTPKNRMYLSYKTSTTHTPIIINPQWLEANRQSYLQKTGDASLWQNREHLPIDTWLNGVRWSDDLVKQIILGFRERGLEDETLFIIQGDHGIPFLGDWKTPVNNPHNEPYRIPFMLYNPKINNPTKRKLEGNYYTLSIPTTLLDIMALTGSFEQDAQYDLAYDFATHYEYAQSLIRPINQTMRFFTVDPGGQNWIVDNGKNLRCRFFLTDNNVRLVDYVKDPLEHKPMQSWGGVESLIADGAEERFGEGTAAFLREAYTRQEYMKTEIIRRYGMESVRIPF